MYQCYSYFFLSYKAEFDENAPVVKDEDADEEDQDQEQDQEQAKLEGGITNSSSSSSSSSSSNKVVTSSLQEPINEAAELDLEAEFASWQEKVGPDFKAIENSLKPIEKYGLRLHTDIEPFYSIFYLSEQQKLDGLTVQSQAEEWDIDKIEKEKEEVYIHILLYILYFLYPPLTNTPYHTTLLPPNDK